MAFGGAAVAVACVLARRHHRLGSRRGVEHRRASGARTDRALTIAVTAPRAITCKRGFAASLAAHLAATRRGRGLFGLRRRHRPRLTRRRHPLRHRRTDAARRRQRPHLARRAPAALGDHRPDRPARPARSADPTSPERARPAPPLQDQRDARTPARRVRLRRDRRAARGGARAARLGAGDAPQRRRVARRGHGRGIRARRRPALPERDRGGQEQRCPRRPRSTRTWC